MGYDSYIFDLDGTLLDTIDDLAFSCNYALEKHGMPHRSIEEVKAAVGNGVKKLLERTVPEGLNNPMFDQTFAAFKEHYLIHCTEHTYPYPGITELLTELRERGKHIAVVSNKFDAATKGLVKHFFGKTVEVAIGEYDINKRKPAPDMVFEALKEMGQSHETAIYIGDSNVDIDTAQNSRLPCVSVLWGFRSADFLIASGASILVSKPKDILDL